MGDRADLGTNPQTDDPPVKEREFEAFLRDTAVPLVSREAGLVEQQHVGKPRDPSSTEYA